MRRHYRRNALPAARGGRAWVMQSVARAGIYTGVPDPDREYWQALERKWLHALTHCTRCDLPLTRAEIEEGGLCDQCREFPLVRPDVCLQCGRDFPPSRSISSYSRKWTKMGYCSRRCAVLAGKAEPVGGPHVWSGRMCTVCGQPLKRLASATSEARPYVRLGVCSAKCAEALEAGEVLELASAEAQTAIDRAEQGRTTTHLAVMFTYTQDRIDRLRDEIKRLERKLRAGDERAAAGLAHARALLQADEMRLKTLHQARTAEPNPTGTVLRALRAGALVAGVLSLVGCALACTGSTR